QQRRGERQAEEQRRERHPDEVQPHHRPRPPRCPLQPGGGDGAVIHRLGGDGHPKYLGSTLSDVLRSSSSVTVNSPCTSAVGGWPSGPGWTPPRRVAGSCRASHIDRTRLSSVRGTATSARPADSENRKMNGPAPSANSSGITRRQPVSPASADSTTAWISPPSLRSWAADTSPSREAATSTSESSFSRAKSTRGGRPPRWSAVTWAQMEPSNSSW